MKCRSASTVVSVSVFLMILMAFAAGPAPAETGVTDEEVLIGCIADLSGPIAFMGKGLTDGARMYFNYINDQGGVHGRNIRMIVEDDMYQSPRAVQAARKLVTRDRVFCLFMVLGSAQSNAMYPFLEANSIPLLFPGTQARQMAIPPRRYLFLSDTTNTTMGKVAIEYFVEEMGMTDPVIACIYQDDTPGHDWLRGIKIGAAHYGFDVLELPYRRAAVDFSTHIARCKDAGVTHVTMYTNIREPALIMREAQRQQYRAIFICNFASMQTTTLDLAGDAVDYTLGFYGMGNVYDFDRQSHIPKIIEYMKNADRYGLEYDNFFNLYGYMSATLLVEAFERTGRNLTREGIVEALETFEDFGFGIMPPVTFGPSLRDGARAVGVGKAVGGKWKSLLPDGEWLYSNIEEY